MKKKGEIEINYLIGLTIVLVVGVIVGTAIYAFSTGKAIPFFELLPGFNQTAGEVEDIARVRYNTLNGDVEYYDGEEWLGFEAVRLGEHDLSGEVAKQDFFNYWISGERNSATYESASITYLFVMSPQGEILIDRELKGAVQESRLKALVLTSDNDLVYASDRGGKKPEINEIERERLIEAIENWKESVLEKPIFISTLPYPPRPFYVCVKKIDDYLVVDLSEEVSENAKCSLSGGLE